MPIPQAQTISPSPQKKVDFLRLSFSPQDEESGGESKRPGDSVTGEREAEADSDSDSEAESAGWLREFLHWRAA